MSDVTIPLLPLSADLDNDDLDSDTDTLIPPSSRFSAPLLLISVPRRWRRPRPLRARSCLILIFLAVGTIFILIPLFIHVTTASAFPAKIRSPYDDIAIVSLASSLSRLHKTLPYTLRTLHAQSVRPREIRIYLPEAEEQDVLRLKANGGVSEEFETGNVKMYFVPDQGPGTKFLPLLTEHLTLASYPDPASARYLSQPLIILDDDHLYSPSMISALLQAHFAYTPSSPYMPSDSSPARSNLSTSEPIFTPFNMSGAALGLRGQRIRPNLHWENPYYANGRYTVHGWQIDEPYRTGYLTANAGYLILPSYFLHPHLLPPSSPHPPSSPYTYHAAILNYTGAPEPAKLVDDIWINAHLSLTFHPRVIIPLPASPPSLALDQFFSSKLLTRNMQKKGVSRQEANDVVIKYYKDAWEAEGGVWFREDDKGDREQERKEGAITEGGEWDDAEVLLRARRKGGPDPVWASWWRRKVMNRVWALGLVWRSFVTGFGKRGMVAE